VKDDLIHESNRGLGLTPMNQLLLALRFYATGSFQLVVGDTFLLHKSTVCRILHTVTAAIGKLQSKYVLFPSKIEQRRDVMNNFHASSSMPEVIGAVDCAHIAIQSPGSCDAEIYRNRKGYFSINVQLVCDNTGYISDVVARWPGSVHDSTIFDNSHIRARLETCGVDGYLVGDGGYPCRRYLLTPVCNPTTNAEKQYNAAQIKARNCIERTNGILKRRFPALKYGLRLTRPYFASDCCYCCIAQYCCDNGG
jgi:nuclease HARBI1